ncbi:MAG: DEAD/DEAH box helicase family protein [Paraglaciecola sp.]|uniref:DEAD/DEAH box helicase n=1 Tax=Paraglaciecola sp. TaxID=1920173 RepID=UPI00273D7B9E|nr:DEAD/DEAH box helicase family protein [Paraglaciecola sp.]MDP5032824.1 DEAD/DEAH box helicase family protein [Paraglaciecola sp.]MDP5129809.1 DEAD/DEAH box helicase family protein [Paraglaciecola sp.]
MQLRHWQESCASLALQKFQRKQKHFLALATPGAGKTVMAAVVAKRLFEANEIDYVVCFAPSVAVLNSMRSTFSTVLARPMHGQLGAAGGVFTYQYLASSKTADWSFLRTSRVFIVFDEIHHCGGDKPEMANTWGREVLINLGAHAKFILSMTGTPWRSDLAPITLASYLEPDKMIRCDYVYGIYDAIKDGVCRLPEVVLIDNDKLQVNEEAFSSLATAMANSELKYSELLIDKQAVRYLLKTAVKQLIIARQEQPNAAGLVVASSVHEAANIRHILESEFNQTTVMVSYRETDPQTVIERFRTSDTQWIVSVTMISEGTDIPRLRVCAHLSLVRTELFFRQVLGRILRMMPNILNKKAWLISFAEKSLLEFAQRLQQDIPEQIVRFEKQESPSEPGQQFSDEACNSSAQKDKTLTSSKNWSVNSQVPANVLSNSGLLFSLQGSYRQKVFSIF